MKKLKVVVFKSPKFFSATILGGIGWKFGMIIDDPNTTKPVRAIRWVYHKRPNLGWWKKLKEDYFPCPVGLVTKFDPDRVLAEWIISDNLYDEISRWFNEKYYSGR